MAITEKDRELMKQVAEYFENTAKEDADDKNRKYKLKREDSRSVNDTASHFNITRTKAMKMLITVGAISTPISKQAQELRAQGKSIKEIAETLGMSVGTVSSNLPYEDEIHGGAEVSEHAAAMRGYRAYEKAQAERMKGKEEEATTCSVNTEEGRPAEVERQTEEKMISRKIGEHTLPTGLIRLHVELGWVDNEEDEKILQTYGGVKRGRTITRDIIVPAKMPLTALHFTLQRAFGFQDSHLHRFEIYGCDQVGVAGNKMENLMNLRGVIFTQSGEDGYYDGSVYHGGSFKNWLKKQYTGPWFYFGDGLEEFNDPEYEDVYEPESSDEVFYLAREIHAVKDEEESQEDFEWEHTETLPAFMVEEAEGEGECIKFLMDKSRPWDSKYVRCNADDPDAMSLEKTTLGELDVYYGLRAIDKRPDRIIERLPIRNVLAPAGDYLPYNEEGKKVHSVVGLKHPQIVTKEQIAEAMRKGNNILPRPFTDMLVYIYDFGDNWHFYITGSKGCSDLVEAGVITRAEMDRAVEKAQREQHPVLLARDGDMLIEDCGNVRGFCEFLEFVNPKDEVIKQENDFGDPDDFDGDWDDLDEVDLAEERARWDNPPISWGEDSMDWDDEEDDEEDEEDEDEERDENGMTRQELLDWAMGQGWHRNDTSDINLL